MLPAIVFHFDRVNCEKLAIGLSAHLEGQEREARAKDGTQDKINTLDRQLEVEKKWYLRHARDAESKIETKNLAEGIQPKDI